MAMRLYEFCEYPAVRYKILFHLLDRPYDDPELSSLRPAFLKSNIVEELYRVQGLIIVSCRSSGMAAFMQEC
jgi:hypothetical protein